MERDLGRYLGVHCALMNRTKEKKKKNINHLEASCDRSEYTAFCRYIVHMRT